eukprot:GEMP01006999.1.p1 GENE.GEMP01006999.1~~GEMP01006999.1.p1  ORF type:complete len:1059 (+),score=235.62 GEMP01006999.1:267-3179(+)
MQVDVLKIGKEDSAKEKLGQRAVKGGKADPRWSTVVNEKGGRLTRRQSLWKVKSEKVDTRRSFQDDVLSGKGDTIRSFQGDLHSGKGDTRRSFQGDEHGGKGDTRMSFVDVVSDGTDDAVETLVHVPKKNGNDGGVLGPLWNTVKEDTDYSTGELQLDALMGWNDDTVGMDLSKDWENEIKKLLLDADSDVMEKLLLDTMKDGENDAIQKLLLDMVKSGESDSMEKLLLDMVKNVEDDEVEKLLLDMVKYGNIDAVGTLLLGAVKYETDSAGRKILLDTVKDGKDDAVPGAIKQSDARTSGILQPDTVQYGKRGAEKLLGAGKDGKDGAAELLGAGKDGKGGAAELLGAGKDGKGGAEELLGAWKDWKDDVAKLMSTWKDEMAHGAKRPGAAKYGKGNVIGTSLDTVKDDASIDLSSSATSGTSTPTHDAQHTTGSLGALATVAAKRLKSKIPRLPVAVCRVRNAMGSSELFFMLSEDTLVLEAMKAAIAAWSKNQNGAVTAKSDENGAGEERDDVDSARDSKELRDTCVLIGPHSPHPRRLALARILTAKEQTRRITWAYQTPHGMGAVIFVQARTRGFLARAVFRARLLKHRVRQARAAERAEKNARLRQLIEEGKHAKRMQMFSKLRRDCVPTEKRIMEDMALLRRTGIQLDEGEEEEHSEETRPEETQPEEPPQKAQHETLMDMTATTDSVARPSKGFATTKATARRSSIQRGLRSTRAIAGPKIEKQFAALQLVKHAKDMRESEIGLPRREMLAHVWTGSYLYENLPVMVMNDFVRLLTHSGFCHGGDDFVFGSLGAAVAERFFRDNCEDQENMVLAYPDFIAAICAVARYLDRPPDEIALEIGLSHFEWKWKMKKFWALYVAGKLTPDSIRASLRDQGIGQVSIPIEWSKPIELQRLLSRLCLVSHISPSDLENYLLYESSTLNSDAASVYVDIPDDVPEYRLEVAPDAFRMPLQQNEFAPDSR